MIASRVLGDGILLGQAGPFGGLTWLTPGLAGLAAAVAIPTLLLLYFLKLRRQDVPISSTLLWKKAVEDLRANAPFQRLRRNVLLLLQLLALAAVLLALAQPRIEGRSVQADRLAIVIDRGVTMRTMDGTDADGLPCTRLEEAKRRALAQVEAMREPGLFSAGRADRALVVAFDATADLLQPLTSNKALLREAILAIQPSDAPSSLDEALRLVRAQAPMRPPPPEAPAQDAQPSPGPIGLIQVYGDGLAHAGSDVELHAEDRLEFVSLGQPGTGNVGITAIDARRQLRDPQEVSVLVGIQSTLDRQASVGVELLVDGVSAAARIIELPAAVARDGQGGGAGEGSAQGEQARGRLASATTGGVEFRLRRGDAATIEVRLQDAATGQRLDAFDRDDRAWVVLPGAKRLRLALVTTGSLVLSEALASLPVERVDVFLPGEFERIEDPLTRYDAVVLDGWLPDPRSAGPLGLPAGQWLVFDAVPSGAYGLIDQGAGPATELIDWRADHPALRGLGLSSVRLASSRLVGVREGGSAEVIASAGVGPAILALEDARTRAIVVPWDLDQSNWWLQPSFIVFLGQAIAHVTLGGPGDAIQASRPGSTRSERLPSGVEAADLLLPSGERLSLPVDNSGQVVVGPLREVGLYTLAWDGPAGPGDARDGSRSVRRFAVNLADTRASDVAARRELLVQGERIAGKADADGQQDTSELWPWLLAIALAVVMLEWYVYNRKMQL
ncbi:MAG: lipoprotein [Phycisphaerales bacterium]|nr:MAG: lipoprotein [Phycisphaerales bacterium]